MFANPASFGLPVPSSGSITLLRVPPSDASWGSQTAGAISPQAAQGLQRRTLSGSIGSMFVGFVQELVATASSHTIIDAVIFPGVVEETVWESVEDAGPDELQLPGVLGEIEALTGLKKTRIAEDLFGVSRQTYNAWERRLNISDEHLSHVLETLDVLRRANRLYAGRENLRTWLNMPRGARAERPRDLIRAGEFGKARLLAISTAPPRDKPIPEWVLRSSPDPWTVAQRHLSERPAADDEPFGLPDDD